MALGRGHSLTEAQSAIDQVVEGVPAARGALGGEPAGRGHAICREIYRVMYERKPIRAAVQALMGREVRSETE